MFPPSHLGNSNNQSSRPLHRSPPQSATGAQGLSSMPVTAPPPYPLRHSAQFPAHNQACLARSSFSIPSPVQHPGPQTFHSSSLSSHINRYPQHPLGYGHPQPGSEPYVPVYPPPHHYMSVGPTAVPQSLNRPSYSFGLPGPGSETFGPSHIHRQPHLCSRPGEYLS